jgi:hypothetical protein
MYVLRRNVALQVWLGLMTLSPLTYLHLSSLICSIVSSYFSFALLRVPHRRCLTVCSQALTNVLRQQKPSAALPNPRLTLRNRMYPTPSPRLAGIKPEELSNLEAASIKSTLYVTSFVESDDQVGPESKNAIVVVYDIFGFW